MPGSTPLFAVKVGDSGDSSEETSVKEVMAGLYMILCWDSFCLKYLEGFFVCLFTL